MLPVWRIGGYWTQSVRLLFAFGAGRPVSLSIWWTIGLAERFDRYFTIEMRSGMPIRAPHGLR
jgi:hypothetical protein